MKRKKKVIFILLLILFVSGCSGKRELNELAIVVAMGIDKVDDQYEVSIQVVDPHEVAAKQGSSGRVPVVTYHAKGSTIFEAIRRMTTVTPRKPYFSHIQVLIIGEELAKDGISDTLDLLSRDNELRSDFYVMVSDQSTAKEVLGIITPLEKVPANKMYSSIEVSEKVWGPTSTVHIHKAIFELSAKGKNTILTNIRIIGDSEKGSNLVNVEKIDSPAKLQYSGLAVIKQDKLVGILTEEESKGYNYLKNNIKSTVEVLSCPDGGNLSMELTDAKTKVKGNVKNGVPAIDVSITIQQNVDEVNCHINLEDMKTITLLNNDSKTHFKKIIEETLVTFQKDYQIDTLGFGEAIHRADHKAWKKIKDDWVELFPDVKVNLTIDVNTTGIGTTKNSTLHKQKE